jgi:hypothetical protein
MQLQFCQETYSEVVLSFTIWNTSRTGTALLPVCGQQHVQQLAGMQIIQGLKDFLQHTNNKGNVRVT